MDYPYITITKGLVHAGRIGGVKELYDDATLCTAMLNETAGVNENITKHLLDYHSKYWNKPSSVLELACGTGTMTKAAAKLNIPSVGIDFAPALIDLANAASSGLDTYALSNISEFKLDRKFDLGYVSWCTLAYLTKAEFISHLQCVYDQLEEGGTYYMSLGSYLDATSGAVPRKLRWRKTPLLINGVISNHFIGEYTSSFCKKTKQRKVVFFAISEVTGKAVSAIQVLQTYTVNDLLRHCRAAGFSKIRPVSIVSDDWKNRNSDIRFNVTTYSEADMFALVK